MTSNKYYFSLPIGDWSDDGHGKCDYYRIKSSKPIDYVRDVYFVLQDKGLGLDGHTGPCGKYEDSSISKLWLDNAGVKLTDFMPNYLEEYTDREYLNVDITTEDFVNLFIFLMNREDPSLELKYQRDEDTESFTFFGYKTIGGKQRHISHLGYGLFDI